jgi:hypothetical protein
MACRAPLWISLEVAPDRTALVFSEAWVSGWPALILASSEYGPVESSVAVIRCAEGAGTSATGTGAAGTGGGAGDSRGSGDRAANVLVRDAAHGVVAEDIAVTVAALDRDDHPELVEALRERQPCYKT